MLELGKGARRLTARNLPLKRKHVRARAPGLLNVELGRRCRLGCPATITARSNLHEPAQDLLNVGLLQGGDRDDEPRVVNDVVQVQLADELGLRDVRRKIDLVRAHQ